MRLVRTRIQFVGRVSIFAQVPKERGIHAAPPARASPSLKSPRSGAFGFAANAQTEKQTGGWTKKHLQKAARRVRKGTEFLTAPPPEGYSRRAAGIEKAYQLVYNPLQNLFEILLLWGGN